MLIEWLAGDPEPRHYLSIAAYGFLRRERLRGKNTPLDSKRLPYPRASARSGLARRLDVSLAQQWVIIRRPEERIAPR